MYAKSEDQARKYATLEFLIATPLQRAWVADIGAVSLPALHRGNHRFAAQRHGDLVLELADAGAVASQWRPIRLDGKMNSSR